MECICTSKHRLWSPKGIYHPTKHKCFAGNPSSQGKPLKPLNIESEDSALRKRNCRVQVRLDSKEYQSFVKQVKKAGLSQEVYLRHLINGVVPQDAPPPAYFDFMRELHLVGNNLNQIAQKAHVLNVIDAPRYDAAARQLETLIRDITAAVILPRRMT